jgi:hypothetical protein
MEYHMHSPDSADNLHLPWLWCARCHRTYLVGIGRVIRFRADGLHPHPAALTLCPYVDCNASATREGWRWKTIQHEHPEYPVRPALNVIYLR